MLELKLHYNHVESIYSFPYNRTMLELKWRLLASTITVLDLIIVQCLNWNWCDRGSLFPVCWLIIVQCLNWNGTMMIVENTGAAYNRTMLELKFEASLSNAQHNILIIVQCLNWNHEQCLYKPPLHPYNRTMLELKFGSITGNQNLTGL